MKRNICCGDFNAHHSVWGSEKINFNNKVLEEFSMIKTVCLNDGKKTRIDINSGNKSVTFVTSSLAPLCEWQVRNLRII